MDSPGAGNVDEAQEKLFGENSSEPKIEIKLVDHKNGDTKIDMSEVRQAFVGMGKEELMQFANNPFWVRMRWFLFILFWALWFGMLAGAIAIILLAPKCNTPAQSKWYQESPIYHLNLKNFKDHSDDGIGDIPGLESKLDYFKDLGVETILLDPIMKTAPDTDDVIDFKSVDPNYGTLNDLKNLIASAKEKGLHLLMKIVPNYSSIKHEWFNMSVSGVDQYKDYYVWTDPKINSDGEKVPLNNWMSVNGGPAWTFNPERKQFYLHQFGSNQPDLNFRNPNVVKYFEDVINFWLSQGFHGLYLDKVEYLVEDNSFADEAPSGSVGTVHDEYDFQSHSRTAHRQESWDILSKWAPIFKSHSAILAVSGVADFKDADIVVRPFELKQAPSKVEDLERILLNRINKTSQAWGFSCDACDERTRLGLQALLLMMPGAVIIPSGLEIGLPPSSIFQFDSKSPNYGFTIGKPWKQFAPGFENRTVESERNSATSFFSTFQKIIKERHDPSILQGGTTFSHQNNVLSFMRSKVGSPQYLVLFNLKETDQDFDLNKLFTTSAIPEKFSLVTNLSYAPSSIDLKNQPSDGGILKIPSYSFVVYTYVSES